MWVAPTYRQSRYAFKRLMSALRLSGGMSIISRVSESDMVIGFINHSLVSFRTAENYDNLRAEGINRLVIDEAARIPKAAWEEVLRPAISDTGGDVMFISFTEGKRKLVLSSLVNGEKILNILNIRAGSSRHLTTRKYGLKDIELAKKDCRKMYSGRSSWRSSLKKGGKLFRMLMSVLSCRN